MPPEIKATIMTQPSPLKRLTLAQQIKAVLLDQITTGQLKPGDRLIELKIAKQIKTSQAPVREALRELEALGVIEIRPNRGTIIRDITPPELKEIYAVRAALEALAAQQVAKTAPHLGIKLQALCDRMEASERMQYSGAFANLSQEFHEVMIKGSANNTLIEMWEKIEIRTRMAQSLLSATVDHHATITLYRQIAEAILSGDDNRASTLITNHFQNLASDAISKP